MSSQSSPILTSNTHPAALKSQEIRVKINVFTNILSNVGVSLSFNEELHTLSQEQVLVARDIEQSFTKSRENIEEFIKGLKLLCKKKRYCRKCLLPSRYMRSTEANETISAAIEMQQECLFRIFLRINCLQKQIIDILLDEITATSSEEMQDTSWLRLLLNPLRYLPHIMDPQNLTTKLLDILDIAAFPAQLEILDSIPEIIPDSEYGKTAKELSKLLDTNDELSGAIIDCLNALDLDADIRAQVQDRILAKIVSGTSLKMFPILLQFLLTDCKSQSLVETLIKIRNALDTIMFSAENSKEKESCKIVIFNRLQTFATSPKNVTESWLNMISAIKVHTDHRPIDYLILFMLHTTVQFKRRVIEAIFRKRVHAGLFKISLLEKMFEKYIPQQLLKDYFNSVMDVGCTLLRSSSEQTILEFATTLFRILFNHSYTEVIYRKEILERLILLTGVGDKNTVGSVLKIISLLLTDSNKLQQHVVLLMRLLEKLNTLELKDVKEVFEILCRLTCQEQAEESMSGLRDEIHMVVRKQLSSSKRSIKHRAIISAVVMAKHIVLRSEEQTNVELPYSKDSTITIAMLPKGPAWEAASLLELTSTCTVGCPELMGLYYDQVAAMLSSTTHLDKYFMAWLHETSTAEFESIYVTQTVLDGINDLQFSMQYLLNTAQEMETPMGVNIAGLTLGCENGSILLLASHFRLLRLVHYRQQAGNISTIDALLGFAVILPDVEDVTDLDTDQVKQVADCLFHCVNWFRELINGFLTQKNKKLRAKVVQRVQDMIEVENKLRICMEKIPDHKLPVSYFDSLLEVNKQLTSPTKQDKLKNPKKKFKSAATINEADNTVASTSAATQAKKKKSTSKMDVPEFHITFREMDTDLVLLFKYPLKFETDDNAEQYATQTATLNINQLKFLLNDYASKLAILTRGKNVGLSHLIAVPPMTVMNDLLKILPLLYSHFNVIIKKINKLLETTDGRHDLPEMYTVEAVNIKTCFSLVLEVFYLVFSWTGFQHSRNLDLLKNILKSVRSSLSQSLNSVNKLITEFINQIGSHYERCLQLSHAVSLVKTMEALYLLITPSPQVEKKIIAIAEKLLSKRWYNSKGVLDIGKSCNANISILVRVYLKGANVETLGGLVGTLQEQASALKAKDDCLHMMASIDKQNFHIFYMGLCNALLDRVKTEVQSLTSRQHLVLWKTTALTMQGLMMIAKARESKINLIYFLKKSIGVLNVFLSHGIPIMEIMLRSRPDEVVTILKTIQTTTRFLHHLCCYSKFMKDVSLVAHVPRFRLTLETLVYKVKAMLVANNCSAAFWMGALRNRDLQGDDILSQTTSITEDNDENSEDEELPEDDSDEDALVITNSDDRSVESEVFD